MFDITTSRDFYAKLVEDFDDFMAKPESARLALNCAITAYHLYEWVWGDWLKADYAIQKVLGVRDRDSFAAWIRSVSVWFAIVESLANGTKHFIRNQGFETMRVSGNGQGPYGVGPYGKGYLVIDHGEGAGEHRWMPTAHLLEVVVRFWRDFFKKYRPGEEIPVSVHHVDQTGR